jgi:hypothetical protein
MKPAILILSVAVVLVTTAIKSLAALGWTLDECEQHYGKPTNPSERKDGKVVYFFHAKSYSIAAFILNGKVSRVMYSTTAILDSLQVKEFLTSNAPDADWGEPVEDRADDSYRWEGKKDRQAIYWAALKSLGAQKILAIWTQEDDDADSDASEQISESV